MAVLERGEAPRAQEHAVPAHGLPLDLPAEDPDLHVEHALEAQQLRRRQVEGLVVDEEPD
ncbi:MAG TPA: hypothetical protein VF080_11480 [Solirubrobacteraceae bacterium]